MRICTKCGEEKELSRENYLWITHKGRFEAQCIVCRYARRKELRGQKPKVSKPRKSRKPDEYYKAYKQKWIEENRERVRKKIHENYLKNREKILERTAAWRKKNKEKYNLSVNLSRKKEPIKEAARSILKFNIQQGKIVRPTRCEDCQKECKPQAHHHDYSKPIEVKWVCSACHGIIHRHTRKG